jgi:hypothetical protein
LVVSLGDAVEREEHADVDGTASKKTSPSVAQRSKKKKKTDKNLLRAHYKRENGVQLRQREEIQQSGSHKTFNFCFPGKR